MDRILPVAWKVHPHSDARHAQLHRPARQCPQVKFNAGYILHAGGSSTKGCIPSVGDRRGFSNSEQTTCKEKLDGFGEFETAMRFCCISGIYLRVRCADTGKYLSVFDVRAKSRNVVMAILEHLPGGTTSQLYLKCRVDMPIKNWDGKCLP